MNFDDCGVIECKGRELFFLIELKFKPQASHFAFLFLSLSLSSSSFTLFPTFLN